MTTNDGLEVYLVHDNVHIFKNVSNKWITEPLQELTFHIDGIEYKCCYCLVIKHLVCKVFDDQTLAAFEAVKDKSSYHPGTVKLMALRPNWFKMMNVKDRSAQIR